MKQIMDAIGKAVQALLSAKTLWFLIIVAASVSVFLSVYFNNGLGKLLWGMGCSNLDCVSKNDLLGLCTWGKDYRHWTGLTAVITIFFLIIGLLFRLWTALQPSAPAEESKTAATNNRSKTGQQANSSTALKQA